MTRPLFPSTIGTQSRFAEFLTIKTVVRKFGKSDGQSGFRCFDRTVLAQGGGGVVIDQLSRCLLVLPATTTEWGSPDTVSWSHDCLRLSTA